MSVTAAVCCTVLFKSIAACAYAGEDGKLIDAMVHGGDAGGGLLSLLPNRKSDRPEKHAKKLIAAVADDLTAYLETERVSDGEALFADLHQFGPIIIAHNAPGLTEMIVKQGGGDWQKATILVLGNIPGSETDGRVGEGLNAFRPSRHNRPQRAAFAHVLDNLHCALFAPQDRQSAVNAAMQIDIQERLGRIEGGVQGIEFAVNVGNEIGEDTNAKISIMYEFFQKSFVSVDSAAIRFDSEEKAQSESEGMSGDKDSTKRSGTLSNVGIQKTSKFYRDRAILSELAARKNREAAATDWCKVGALAFQHDTFAALEAFNKAVELNPDNTEARIQLGHLLSRIGKLEQAELAYKDVEAIVDLQNEIEPRTIFENSNNTEEGYNE